MKLYCYKSENYGTWSAFIKNDEADLTANLSLQFVKGSEPKGTKAVVEVDDGFFTLFARKNGSVEYKLVITEWHKAK